MKSNLGALRGAGGAVESPMYSRKESATMRHLKSSRALRTLLIVLLRYSTRVPDLKFRWIGSYATDSVRPPLLLDITALNEVVERRSIARIKTALLMKLLANDRAE